MLPRRARSVILVVVLSLGVVAAVLFFKGRVESGFVLIGFSIVLCVGLTVGLKQSVVIQNEIYWHRYILHNAFKKMSKGDLDSSVGDQSFFLGQAVGQFSEYYRGPLDNPKYLVSLTVDRHRPIGKRLSLVAGLYGIVIKKQSPGVSACLCVSKTNALYGAFSSGLIPNQKEFAYESGELSFFSDGPAPSALDQKKIADIFSVLGSKGFLVEDTANWTVLIHMGPPPQTFFDALSSLKLA